MMASNKEQLRHDVINLSKTVKLLEHSVDDENWTELEPSNYTNKWLKAQSILAGISYSRRILLRVSPSNYDIDIGAQRSISGQQFNDDIKQTLDRLEQTMIGMKQELKPLQRRSIPILPSIRRTKLERNAANSSQHSSPKAALNGMDAGLLPVDESELKGQTMVIPSNDFIVDSSTSTMLPVPSQGESSDSQVPNLNFEQSTSGRTEKKASASMPEFLKTSTAMQEDLADQMARMARQLKMNATYFAESLEKDKAVVQEAGQKLEQNYDLLSKERVRLRDHSGKSKGTTCLVLMSLVVVMLGFVLTFFVVRIT